MHLLEILGTLSPIKFPPFPEAAWGELLRPFKRRLAVKSMRGTRRSAERSRRSLQARCVRADYNGSLHGGRR
jgi:hypothetical protein